MPARMTLATLLVVFATTLLPAQSGDSPTYVIRNVRVFDGQTIAERQTVVLTQGRIAAVGGSDVTVPAGAQDISGEGRTLLPGLMDAHIHLPAFPVTAPADALRQLLDFGVTTVIVMGTAYSQTVARIKGLEEADAPDMSAVLSAGIMATVPGGHGDPMQTLGAPIPTLTKPNEADAFVAARVAEGADFLKIIFDDTSGWFPAQKLPTLDEATVAALAAAAHARNRIAVAHIGSEDTARGAIAAGVDGLAHLFPGATVSSDFGAFAAQHGVFVIPTLSAIYPDCGRSAAPEFLNDPGTMTLVRPPFRSFLDQIDAGVRVSCEAAPQALRQLVAARVPVLVGTDVPAPGTMYGASVHKEMEYLVEAGLTPMAALAAATSAAATAFRMTDRGWIKPGMRADLLLVDGDPTKQIRDTRHIVAVWKRGVRGAVTHS
jgi:imidazolonepropionase-like amidohydrolase